MSKTSTEIYLSIGLEHKDGKVAYAGNHDECMSVFICGTSMFDRYGYEAGLAAHEKYVEPNVNMVDVFTFFLGDFGDTMYSLDDSDSNRLLMKLDSWVTMEELTTMLNTLWPCIEGVYLSDDDESKNPVCIKDIRIITNEIVTITEKFMFTPEIS